MPKIPFSVDSRFATAARASRAPEPAKSRIWRKRAERVRTVLQPVIVLMTMAAMGYLAFRIAQQSGVLG